MSENYLKKELHELIQIDSTIFEFIQEGSLDGIWYWDLKNPENEYMSEKFWELFGINPTTKKHKASEWQDIIFEEDLKTAIENFQKHLEDPNHPYDQMVRYRHTDGSTIWVRCRGIAIRDENGVPIRMLGAHNDFTQQKKLEAELTRINQALQKQTITDHLTGLYNRYFIDKLLLVEKERTIRNKSPFSILLLDMNKFKLINDNFGHLTGDQVLIHIGKVLRKSVRKQDTVSRWGGDEFLILLPDTPLSNSKVLSEKIKEIFKNNPYKEKNRMIPISISIGCSEYDGTKSIDNLLVEADKALYKEKEKR